MEPRDEDEYDAAARVTWDTLRTLDEQWPQIQGQRAYKQQEIENRLTDAQLAQLGGGMFANFALSTDEPSPSYLNPRGSVEEQQYFASGLAGAASPPAAAPMPPYSADTAARYPRHEHHAMPPSFAQASHDVHPHPYQPSWNQTYPQSDPMTHHHYPAAAPVSYPLYAEPPGLPPQQPHPTSYNPYPQAPFSSHPPVPQYLPGTASYTQPPLQHHAPESLQPQVYHQGYPAQAPYIPTTVAPPNQPLTTPQWPDEPPSSYGFGDHVSHHPHPYTPPPPGTFHAPPPLPDLISYHPPLSTLPQPPAVPHPLVAPVPSVPRDPSPPPPKQLPTTEPREALASFQKSVKKLDAESPPLPAASTSAAPPPTSFAEANEAARESIASNTQAAKRGRKTKELGEGSIEAPVAQAAEDKKRNKKVTSETSVTCRGCETPVARLILRGKQHELDVPHSPQYYCPSCGPNSTSGGATAPSSADASPEGTAVPPPPRKGSGAPSMSVFRKRTKRVDGTDTISCDVCLRDIASGGMVADDSGVDLQFVIEVVCTHCDNTYQRCSDCGGGGGNRLGVGKWRSKELFVPGRKTCSLSHIRLGSLNDNVYTVYNINELPAEEIDEVAQQCGKIFENTMLGGMAIPEIFENQSGFVNTYEGVLNMAKNGWRAFDAMIREDVEKARSTRRYGFQARTLYQLLEANIVNRYLALRSCPQNPRKGSKAAPVPVEEPPQDGYVKQILQPSKALVGFVISEYDMLTGLLFLAVVVPWATGEVYDATTILIGSVVRRAEEDRLKMNAERAYQQLPPLPEVLHVWTMMFFKRDSRMLHHLIKKRGFLYLEDYLKKYKDVDPTWFPPTRPTYLPPTFLPDWSVLARRQGVNPHEDWVPRRAGGDVAKSKE